MTTATNGTRPGRRVLRLAMIAVAAVGGLAAIFILPLWIGVLIPRWLVRATSVGALWAIVGLFALTIIVAPMSAGVSAGMLRRARRRREPWLKAARICLLSMVAMVGAGVLELAAAVIQGRSHAAPRLSSEFEDDRSTSPHSISDLRSKALDKTDLAAASDDAIRLVVIGESSANGGPYAPKLSVGQIVGWQLERVLGRRVIVDMRSHDGLTLEEAIDRLRGLQERPDAILVYSGHNEFQKRYRWWREVSHYRKESPPRPPHEAALESLAHWSSLAKLVQDLLEKHRLDMKPPEKGNRHLVDVPACTPAEYAEIRAEFGKRLEALAAYCESIGALPMMVIPPGNDAGFAPMRSVMSADSTAAEREAFARDFLAVRALEKFAPGDAEAAYRRLIERQPGFAESHFRLARLLVWESRFEEARREFVTARDHDGMPIRCPSDFQQEYHKVAARHRVALVDGPAALVEATGHGILDDWLFHDGQHPNLRAYTILSEALLDRLHALKAFGWPEERETPRFLAAECGKHFGMDNAAWATVCRKSSHFFELAAFLRYDPTDDQFELRAYEVAAANIAIGISVEQSGCRSLGY